MRILILSIVFQFSIFFLAAQNATTKTVPKAVLSEKSIIKDSSGQVYPTEIWKRLLSTGYYTLRPENPENVNSDFLLTRLSEEQKQKRLSGSPKPKETVNFKTGQPVNNFSTSDINGKKYKLKELKGKIVVLNFWFINCPPCRAEIPELNKLVNEYKDSSNIVFLAIALDDRDALEQFLKTSPFDYTIVDGGRYIADQYAIKAYPTHAVIDKEGKAYFHTAGAGSTISYWLKKSIEELMAAVN